MKVKPQVKNFATNSDFPEFDEQVLNLIKPYGSIRNIKYYANEDTGFPVLVFNLSGYRYCQNIKGAHFSNNVYFEQIFVNAFCIKNICKRILYQKCYDCIQYSGRIVEVPVRGQFLEEDLNQSMYKDEEHFFDDISASYESFLFSSAQLTDVDCMSQSNEQSSLLDISALLTFNGSSNSIDNKDRLLRYPENCKGDAVKGKKGLTEDQEKCAYLLMLKVGHVPQIIDRNCKFETKELLSH